jgi:hypothetical protein
MTLSARWLAVAAITTSACNAKQKTAITEETFANAEQRAEMLEATMRVMDSHPEYVDEMFAITLKHPHTLERMFSNTAIAVADPDTAHRVALHLAARPRGLREVMVQTLDASQDKPAAQAAISEAMAARANEAAAILVDHPPQLAAIAKALIEQLKAHPQAVEQLKELTKQLAAK